MSEALPLPPRALQRLLAMAAEPDEPAPPPSLPDRYQLVREAGRGGMGVVYEAFDRQLGRRVAIKVLGQGAGPELRARFAREALAVARLRHAHLAVVHDATPDYLVMQWIDGGPIDCVPATDVRTLVGQVRDAALALQHAHEQGIVHRDLKPSNLLVERGHVFVVDFGLAKQLDAGTEVSLAGAVVGTPAFMPPEQALGRSGAADPRSDVYGLGATLYWCLAGRPPFAAAELPSLLRAVVEHEAAPPPGDRDLARIASKCLAKEPERRYPDARALAADLDRWLRHEPVEARPPSLGYRLRKRLQRQRALWRAAAVAVALTALVLGPVALREGAARSAASEAVALADHVAAVLGDAALFTRLGDRDSANHELDAGTARVCAFLLRHEVPRVRYLLSRLLRARGRPDDALAELERVLAAAPELADARFARGLLLAARPQLDDAARATAIADLGVPPDELSVLGDVDRLFGRAERLRLLGESEAAQALLIEVLAYDTMHVPARQALAQAALARGDTGLGLYYAASALDLQQGHAPFYLAREQRALPTAVLGLDGVLVDYAAELPDGPDPSLAFAHRGVVQLRRALRLAGEGAAGEAQAAAQGAADDFAAALQLHPDLAGAHGNHAVGLLLLDRLAAAAGDSATAASARQAAAAAAARAAALAPDSPAAHANLGVVELRTAEVLHAWGRIEAAAGHAAAAAAALTRALGLAPAEWPPGARCRAGLQAAQALGAGR